MGHLGKKIKAAKSGDSGNWKAPTGKGGQKACPGCGKAYARMSAGQLRGHAKAMKFGRQDDCPDV